jgi:predicted DNA-binding transcriptional regulator YafY
MSKSGNKRKRMEQLVLLLQQHGRRWTPKELAGELGVWRETVHDYLNELRDDPDLKVYTENGAYWMDPTQFPHNVRLTYPETLTIFLALRRFIRQTSNAPDFYATAIQKIAGVLRHPVLTNVIVQSNSALVNERRGDAEQDAVWKVLLRGWLESIPVRLRYQKGRSGELTEHVFDPYLFEPAIWSHGVYVLGWSQTRKELRTLRVERIRWAQLSTGRFTPQATLNPEDLLRGAWGIWYGQELTRVELLFCPEMAGRVQETTWHPSQQMTVQADGSLLWTVEVAGTLELVSWIRGWGDEVRVLAPVALRRQIAESLRRAAAQYEEEA